MTCGCKFWTTIVLFGCTICLGEYTWDCVTTVTKGEQRIPSLDIRKSPAGTVISDDNVVYIFRLPRLSDRCYGKVSAIKYCYQYHSGVNGLSGEGFNWTVLILDDELTIEETFHIQSYPDRRQGSESIHLGRQSIRGDQGIHCDAVSIHGFDLPKRDFFFGVTSSDQGNDASLLAFPDSLYMVDAMLAPRADQPQLIKGSTIVSNRQFTYRGVRCLWFVVTTPDFVNSSSSCGSPDPPTKHPTDTPRPTNYPSSWIALLVGIMVVLVVLIFVALGGLTGRLIQRRYRPNHQLQAPAREYDPLLQKGT